MKRALTMVPSIALVAGVLLVAVPAAAEGESTTTITMRVSGCESCAIRPVNARTELGAPYLGDEVVVRNGLATWVVPTRRTVGMYFDIRLPNPDDDEDGIHENAVIAVQYEGATPGEVVGFRQASTASRATPCWAGTADSAVTLDVTARTVKLPGLVLDDDDEYSETPTPAPLAWFTPTQSGLEPLWQPADGVLLTKEFVDCEVQPRSATVVGEVAGQVGSIAWTASDVAVGPKGRKAYLVTPWGTQIIDLASVRQSGVIRTTQAGSIALLPNGRRGFVTPGSRRPLAVVSLRTRKVVRTATTPGRTDSIAITPNGRELYVPVNGQNMVAVMDAARTVVLRRIQLPGTQPRYQVVVSPDGRWAYLASPRGALVAIDTTTRQVARTGQLGVDVSGLAVTPDGTRLLLASPSASALVVVDAATLEQAALWPVNGRPTDVVADPVKERAYLATNDIVPVDLTTGRSLRPIDLPRPPGPLHVETISRLRVHHLAISPAGHRLVAAASNAWTYVVDIGL